MRRTAFVFLLATALMMTIYAQHPSEVESSSEKHDGLVSDSILSEKDSSFTDSTKLLSDSVSTLPVNSMNRSRRRITPVNNAATRTQAINENLNDTARANALRRARSTSYTDDKGAVIFIDTVTGEKWIDSTAISMLPKMKCPLFWSASVGVNIWDPLMRAFGQHYGLFDVWAQMNFHNRYLPIVEIGMGEMNYRPPTQDFTFRVPAVPFFRIGADYNFFYNSNPDYLLLAGLRYGISTYTYSVNDITLDSDYWHETADFSIPSQSATAGWLEIRFGVRVKIWKAISMGWNFRYAFMLHESKSKYGEPWYIPGFGTRGNAIGGTFSIIYTLPLEKLNKKSVDGV